ncbi:hypothetical protein [Gordonia sp. WA4-43]|uniref:hypothetical protein n=1 Tax=Gordonia sp. WA4-43 TaxID=2878678 RepID=UPI001CF9A424|nr:hypothetical protein [Gordonia sp. WA4-43]UCZ90447.1 hypothetical protein LEL84_01735 [Gordonia sp. WA4-43]
MSKPTNLDDLAHRDSINHYLALCALVAEGRKRDAFDYIVSLEDTEKADMWLAGCSITIAFADDCRRFHKVPVELPAWLRLMALADEDGAQ